MDVNAAREHAEWAKNARTTNHVRLAHDVLEALDALVTLQAENEHLVAGFTEELQRWHEHYANVIKAAEQEATTLRERVATLEEALRNLVRTSAPMASRHTGGGEWISRWRAARAAVGEGG